MEKEEQEEMSKCTASCLQLNDEPYAMLLVQDRRDFKSPGCCTSHKAEQIRAARIDQEEREAEGGRGDSSGKQWPATLNKGQEESRLTGSMSGHIWECLESLLQS